MEKEKEIIWIRCPYCDWRAYIEIDCSTNPNAYPTVKEMAIENLANYLKKHLLVCKSFSSLIKIHNNVRLENE